MYKRQIADRCEINRQIKADNALLRELKAEIKKLTALVARTVPAIAEGLEKLRSRVLIFCYHRPRAASSWLAAPNRAQILA